jgi:hypothetical protein
MEEMCRGMNWAFPSGCMLLKGCGPEGVVLDYDEEGNLVGIDIDNASRKIDLKEITLSKIPAEMHALNT